MTPEESWGKLTANMKMWLLDAKNRGLLHTVNPTEDWGVSFEYLSRRLPGISLTGARRIREWIEKSGGKLGCDDNSIGVHTEQNHMKVLENRGYIILKGPKHRDYRGIKNDRE